jgi:hypothetical protein
MGRRGGTDIVLEEDIGALLYQLLHCAEGAVLACLVQRCHPRLRVSCAELMRLAVTVRGQAACLVTPTCVAHQQTRGQPGATHAAAEQWD